MCLSLEYINVKNMYIFSIKFYRWCQTYEKIYFKLKWRIFTIFVVMSVCISIPFVKQVIWAVFYKKTSIRFLMNKICSIRWSKYFILNIRSHKKRYSNFIHSSHILHAPWCAVNRESEWRIMQMLSTKWFFGYEKEKKKTCLLD